MEHSSNLAESFIKDSARDGAASRASGQQAQAETAAFKRWFGDSKVVDAEGKPLVVYHGTDSVFTKFSRTGDIGYHFGTEIAARDRAARVGGTEVLVEPVTLSQVEKDSLAGLNGEIGGTPAADLYALLLRKLDSPRQDLRAQVEAMPADEIKQVKAEYLEQPDSIRFAMRVDRAKAGEGFRVEVNGETVSMHRTVREANARAARLREQTAKPMALYLRIENPIRLPDLGVWPAQEIAKEAGFSKQEMEQVVEADTAEQQYAAVRAILEAKGFDGIVYRNEVEHAGEDSYIAFRPEQIKSATGNVG